MASKPATINIFNSEQTRTLHRIQSPINSLGTTRPARPRVTMNKPDHRVKIRVSQLTNTSRHRLMRVCRELFFHVATRRPTITLGFNERRYSYT